VVGRVDGDVEVGHGFGTALRLGDELGLPGGGWVVDPAGDVADAFGVAEGGDVKFAAARGQSDLGAAGVATVKDSVVPVDGDARIGGRFAVSDAPGICSGVAGEGGVAEDVSAYNDLAVLVAAVSNAVPRYEFEVAVFRVVLRGVDELGDGGGRAHGDFGGGVQEWNADAIGIGFVWRKGRIGVGVQGGNGIERVGREDPVEGFALDDAGGLAGGCLSEGGERVQNEKEQFRIAIKERWKHAVIGS